MMRPLPSGDINDLYVQDSKNTELNNENKIQSTCSLVFSGVLPMLGSYRCYFYTLRKKDKLHSHS